MVSDTPPLPGAIGMSRLRVYPWQTADALHGGSPHLHLTCTECYLVLGGTGELHTLTLDGPRVLPLATGDVVAFTPGTIHRAVNTGNLRVQVIMQNAGLPEAGDAVLTFPLEYLASPQAYSAAASIGSEGQARRRRDLAIEGYLALVEDHRHGGTALERFYAAAGALVADRLDAWEASWHEHALAAAAATGAQIAALRRADTRHLRLAAVTKIDAPEETALGMCGYLAPYPITES
jgi:mannose-6-phosphate isomerase-like protein (cupin superfamily)